MLPATVGKALAKCEMDLHYRVIVFIGDGSLQMSVQEVSKIVKKTPNVMIFVIKDNVNTIEYAIHGRKQGYLEIAS